jgi:hypothetical protein
VSGLIACCGVRWAIGTWSDSLFSVEGVAASFDGCCGSCGQELSNPVVIMLCGEALCNETAAYACGVIGGPVLHLCPAHAEKFAEAVVEAGVKAKIRAWHPAEPAAAAAGEVRP